jgi:hypothetical protein
MSLLLLAVALQTFPPALPDGKTVVTDASDDFLKPPPTLKEGVAVAKTAPTIDFLFFPGQDYPGKPWSSWGDSVCANGKYYCSIGDHHAVNGKDKAHPGTAFVFEYDPAAKSLRRLVDVKDLLKLPEGDYTPGKIHGRLDLGDDGWLYFSTHRGSTTVTTDAWHYKGDWILRVNPSTGASEIVTCGPVAKHCIPCSVLDPKRLIFYGGTAPGSGGDEGGVQFFAYDVKAKKVIYSGPDGPSRYMIFAKSTGKVYWVPGKEDMVGPLVSFDPEKPGEPVKTAAVLGLRAATQETPQGIVYTVSKGAKGGTSTIYAFDTKAEKAEALGDAAVGGQNYITSIDADPSGRYLYYVPGAHGGAGQDGTPVIQFDVKTKQKKVIAFLASFYKSKYGCTPVGTYSTAVDEKGETLYVTWNVNRAGKAWDCVALTAIHIPASER